MVDLLKQLTRADWWPIDKVILAYFAAAMVVELVYWSRLPNPWELLLVHLTGSLLIALAALYPGVPLSHVFHHWYSVFYVFYCYKEMSILIPALRSTDSDAALARIDFDFWGANPSVWLERISSPPLTEVLQIIYSGFVPVVLLIGFLLWFPRRYKEFPVLRLSCPARVLSVLCRIFIVPAGAPFSSTAPANTWSCGDYSCTTGSGPHSTASNPPTMIAFPAGIRK